MQRPVRPMGSLSLTLKPLAKPLQKALQGNIVTDLKPVSSAMKSQITVDQPTVQPPAMKFTFKVSRKLPLMYDTDIPKKLKEALLGYIYNNILVSAPTGFGKTWSVNLVMSEVQPILAQEEGGCICISILPYRISVKEMHSHLTKSHPDKKFGYAMRGDRQTRPDDHVCLMTVGYFLEVFCSNYRQNGLPKKPMIVMVDEAHDATWQTDLALALLLWAQRMGAPIKIIIASATLDVSRTLQTIKTSPLILSAEDKKADVEMKFLDRPIEGEKQGKLTDMMFMEVINTLVHIAETSTEGHILVLVPGLDEILAFIEKLEKNHTFDDFIILPLHSTSSGEEMSLALKPTAKGTRKIIVATNIVQNAITIDGLDYAIDLGYRKELVVDTNGIQQLVMRHTARSNLTQAAGRVGRQGKRGTAYVMMTQFQFECLEAFSQNEVHRNPLYLQIIRLVRDDFPVKAVLCHIEAHRIDLDTLFLIEHGALKNECGKIVVTELGKIMSHLPLSIRAAHFLSLAVTTLPQTMWYTAVVTASWMDSNSSVFFRPGKKPREDQAEYLARVLIVAEAQEKFFEKDCLTTVLKVWFSSWTIPNSFAGGYHKWCHSHGIFDRTLKDMNSAVNHIVGTLETLNIKVKTPSQSECADMLKNISSLVTGVIPALEVAFKDWIFVQSWDKNYIAETPKWIYMQKHFIDKHVRNASVVNEDLPARVMALCLRKIGVGQGKIIMSNLVNLPPKVELAQHRGLYEVDHFVLPDEDSDLSD